MTHLSGAFTVIINRNSGTVLAQTETVVENLLLEILPPGSKIVFIDCSGLEAAIDAATTEHVIIGGGDGTITYGASLMLARNRAFGVLPLGTMNLFVRDLGIEGDYVEVARSYLNAQVEDIDVGEVNGRIFLCNAMLGMAAEMARTREALRKRKGFLKWKDFIMKLIDRLGDGRRHSFHFRSSGFTRKIKAKTLVISNNAYCTDAALPSDRLKKNNLTDGSLGIYIINPHDKLEGLRLISLLALGMWHDDPAIHHYCASDLSIAMPGRKVDALLDGEIFTMQTPLNFRVRARALRVMIPVKESERIAA